MKALPLVLLLLVCSCTTSKAHLIEDKEKVHILECWTWGQATCTIADPDDSSIVITAESKGLSDNGVTAIIKTITGLPKVIIDSLFPVSRVFDVFLPEEEIEE
jgi:hypothetical protein